MKTFIPKVLAIIWCLCSLTAFAQVGKIAGKVIDKKNAEELIGVTVLIEGTNFGASTDLNGDFTINQVKVGTYNLAISYMGYNKKIIKGVEVKANEINKITISLEAATTALKEVVVQGELRKESANALLIQQKNSLTVSDGISADVIKKSPDNTTSDVMKRVSGATVQDNKFAVIRGLNDRYNSAYINGAPLPSTEADKKAFSFDIFPSNMLANMTITKTATPDLPGDFAGGLITINTKDIPDEKFITIGGSIGAHSISTGKQGYTYQGGKTDWLGIDDGTRALPSGIPGRTQYEASSNSDKFQNSSKFNDDWRLLTQNSLAPNSNIQLSAGNKFKLKGEKEIGFVASLSHNQNNRFTAIERNFYDVRAGNDQLNAYTDSAYKQEVLVGAMLNLAFKANANNRYFFKNAYTINSEDQTIQRWGKNNMNNDPINYENKTAYFFQQNLFLTNQLGAEHFIPTNKIKLRWVLNYNLINRDIPDFRRFTRSTTVNEFTGELNPYTAQLQPTIDLTQNGRLYTKMGEQLYSAGVDVLFPVGFLSNKNVKTDFKTGVFYQARSRNFEANVFGHKINYQDPKAYDIVMKDINTIFDRNNLIENTFYIDERINPQDKYSASSGLSAGYIMFNSRIFNRTRAVYGARVESYNQKLDALSASGEVVALNTTVTDVLPSINLSYELTEKANIRLAYFKSLARPEFRELAPFIFYDFNLNMDVTGSPNLERTLINNYDFRIEHFEGEGQMISFSLFYKTFTNAIEPVFEITGGGSYRLGYSSATNAINKGLEIELRKNFDFADKWMGTKFMKNFLLTGNYALISSEVDLSQLAATDLTVQKRPLQGQSNYLLNLGLSYTDTKTNLTASILYNKIGRRIFAVQEIGGAFPNVWENPRDVIDFSISKKLFNKLDIKLTLGDLLAQSLVFYHDNNNNGKFDKPDEAKRAQLVQTKKSSVDQAEVEKASKELTQLDNVIYSYTMGRTISIGLSYKF